MRCRLQLCRYAWHMQRLKKVSWKFAVKDPSWLIRRCTVMLILMTWYCRLSWSLDLHSWNISSRWLFFMLVCSFLVWFCVLLLPIFQWRLKTTLQSFIQFPHLCPLPSNRHHLTSGACLEDNREDNQHCCVLLCTTVLHNDMHTHVSSSYIFRSTLLSWPNKVGVKCPPGSTFRLSVHKTFIWFQWNLACR